MNIKDNLFKLTSAVGVAGDELNASMVACEMLREYCNDANIDYFGNVTGSIGVV